MTTPAERLAALDAAARGPEPRARHPAAPWRTRRCRCASGPSAWPRATSSPRCSARMVADGENAVRRNAGLSALERQGPYAVPHLTGHARRPRSRAGDVRAPEPGPHRLPAGRPLDPAAAAATPTRTSPRRPSRRVGQLRTPGGRARRCSSWWTASSGSSSRPSTRWARSALRRRCAPLMALVPDSVLAEPAVQALRSIAAPESLEPLLSAAPARARARPAGSAAAGHRAW